MPDPAWQPRIPPRPQRRPAARSSAITLAQARERWQHAVIARTSMHDLLFTLPGGDYPFTSSVRVRWASEASVVLRWQDSRLAEEFRSEPEELDPHLDAVLERLTSPALTCRHCGRPVVISAEQFDVFGHPIS